MSDPISKPCVVGIGEALFDVFEAGPRLGGAPLNVAVHCHRLLQPVGGEGRVISKIGADPLGRQLLTQVEAFGLSTADIQRDAHAPTGRVNVEQHNDGGHTFHIANESAWDEIEFGPRAASLAGACDAIAFGTLAQRNPTSREAISSFLAAAPQALKLFDVNFRSSDGVEFFDAAIMQASCEAANLVKVNDEELERACAMVEVKDAAELLQRFGLKAVILTRGKKGTAALTPTGWTEGASAHYDREDDADTVGAGDACSAGVLASLVCDRSIQEALDLANQMGAFVASRSGATPTLLSEIQKRLS